MGKADVPEPRTNYELCTASDCRIGTVGGMNGLRLFRDGGPQRALLRRNGWFAGLYWTIRPADGIRATTFLEPASPMKMFLLKMFTWWNGQTFGTQLWTWRFGELVGKDEQGNSYYRTKGGKIDPVLGFERRWVIYNGYAEATRVPPSWHGWLHHTVDVPPTEEAYAPREWEKPHLPNLTGTPLAYRPSGSTLASGRRPKATGDYQPWTPGN
jgi:NADH:ubiquinone oxidoreductase subunit